MSTTPERLATIAKLSFPRTLRELEVYLGMTGWPRDYVPRYAIVAQPLQDRKTQLLKCIPMNQGLARRGFATRQAFAYPTEAERAAFAALQRALSNPTTLITA